MAENNLLIHPKYKAPVSLSECSDLADDLGEPDGWAVAGRFATEILPGIFRLDDPCVQLRLAPEGRLELEQILDGISSESFQADDSLGWVYQFWQKEQKDAINSAGNKIGGSDLGPVTQLFTENYMVRFLLENSLGAWWAGRHPDSPLLADFEFLRFNGDGSPAAGTFSDWPDDIAEISVMDPCCGSGHFLVEAFGMLWRMRAEEQGLGSIQAQDAVLEENLFGLELDPRCVQIAMFSVALSAWKSSDGWRKLPTPNIACSGIPAKAPVEEWKALANGYQKLELALERLHSLFKDADTLGSLIDPKRTAESQNSSKPQTSFDDVNWEEVAPLLEQAAESETEDPATAVLGASAAGIAMAADLLSRRYVLVATNVPYLGSNRQGGLLGEYLSDNFSAAKWDLATAFIARMSQLSSPSGVQVAVSPAAWCSLSSYKQFREYVLRDLSIVVAVRMGRGAFGDISGEVVQPVLTIIGNSGMNQSRLLDVSESRSVPAKSEAMRSNELSSTPQSRFVKLPGCRIVFTSIPDHPPLSEYASSYWGTGTGDGPRFSRGFWEIPTVSSRWERFQQTFTGTQEFNGRSGVLLWEGGDGALKQLADDLRKRLKNIWRRGSEAWGSKGVAISQSGRLGAALYDGEIFQNGVATVVPHKESDLLPVWAFCSSPEYPPLVRMLDSKISVTNRTLAQVPFDIDHWRKVAEEKYPNGLPEPFSNDPTQWLFEGRPEGSTDPLHVAVGRLLGYRWPDQPESDDLDGLADRDGIVCLPPVAGEAPAADRLSGLLANAFGDDWTASKAGALVLETGSKKKNLSDWLKDDFFKQHAKLFHNRPFIWHNWDGKNQSDKKEVQEDVYIYEIDVKDIFNKSHNYSGQLTLFR